jgi:hypothetical protein
MTAESFAELMDARRTGRGRWQARCPAHHDSSPSLSIKEGRDGRVLLYCFAGCSLTSILQALSLSIRDLFAGEPLSAQQRALLAQERDARDAQLERERRAGREARERVWKLEAIRDALGGKLMRSPENDELDRLYRLALDRLRDAEFAAQHERPVVAGQS